MKTPKTLNWQEVDTSSMTGKVAKAHKTYVDAWSKAQPARQAFETAFLEAARTSGVIDDNQSLQFSYRFGKLSVAVVDQPSEKVTRKQFSL